MSDIASPETLSDNGDNGDADSFERDPVDEAEELTRAAQAVADLASSSSMLFQQIPLFLGHGVEDEQVPFSQGKRLVEMHIGECHVEGV